MEQAILELLNWSLKEGNNAYITELEKTLGISESKSEILAELEDFYFKQGLKAGIYLIQYLQG